MCLPDWYNNQCQYINTIIYNVIILIRLLMMTLQFSDTCNDTILWNDDILCIDKYTMINAMTDHSIIIQ